jgi:hypothetical protein
MRLRPPDFAHRNNHSVTAQHQALVADVGDVGRVIRYRIARAHRRCVTARSHRRRGWFDIRDRNRARECQRRLAVVLRRGNRQRVAIAEDARLRLRKPRVGQQRFVLHDRFRRASFTRDEREFDAVFGALGMGRGVLQIEERVDLVARIGGQNRTDILARGNLFQLARRRGETPGVRGQVMVERHAGGFECGAFCGIGNFAELDVSENGRIGWQGFERVAFVGKKRARQQ